MIAFSRVVLDTVDPKETGIGSLKNVLSHLKSKFDYEKREYCGMEMHLLDIHSTVQRKLRGQSDERIKQFALCLTTLEPILRFILGKLTN